uniref:Uncharacterized protein n=1 Tax=Anguilla anguilla TaxID=7936 RepID=A0A0E9VYW5_ANGAN
MFLEAIVERFNCTGFLYRELLLSLQG